MSVCLFCLKSNERFTALGLNEEEYNVKLTVNLTSFKPNTSENPTSIKHSD